MTENNLPVSQDDLFELFGDTARRQVALLHEEKMKASVLLTGGAGFAGAHICEHLLHNTDWDVVVLDRLTYAGGLERLRDAVRDFPGRIRYVYHDFRAAFPPYVFHRLEGVKYIIHNGAETHVQRSLEDPEPFVTSNVLGTMRVLDAARTLGVEHFILTSTDEVHGPAPEGVSFKEDAPIRPSNPYSASKAGAEALAYAYWRSFNVPVTITRTMNLFGERQHPEKFIPMTIRKVRAGETVTVHGVSGGRVGSRKWLHARNQADALLFLLDKKRLTGPLGYPWRTIGHIFHIAGEEHTNLEIAQMIADIIGKPLKYEMVDFHRTRPGHDARYSLDDSKIRALGWSPPVPFKESLVRTVEWTVAHQEWLVE